MLHSIAEECRRSFEIVFGYFRDLLVIVLPFLLLIVLICILWGWANYE